MGQEITQDDFTRQDFEAFARHLQAEMELLTHWFEGHKFANDDLQCGLELEAWLIDVNGLPAPDNSLFLTTLDRQSVVPELSKFNFEFNVNPQYLRGSGLANMQAELASTWMRCGQVAADLEHRIVTIGILPTVRDSMLCLKNMSPLRRYAALNAQVLRLRKGRPIRLTIEGQDHLSSTHTDLMLESAATSAQVHLKVPEAKAVRYYNAAVIASAVTLAAAANAPLLFGKRLWDDTRITLFEQAVDTAGPAPRVSFGPGYMQSSLLEYFQGNVRNHRVLLPAELDEPPSKLPYVRMHNGTIWSWNRPLIGFESDGQPHLRIEHRPMSASPTLADLFADTLLFLGLTHALATLPEPPEQKLSFEQAKENFYRSARYGLEAQLLWIDGASYNVSDLLLEQLLPHLSESWKQLEIDQAFAQTGGDILAGRVQTRQNGANWQRRKFAEFHGDAQKLLMEYVQHQAQGNPVHTWA